MIGGPSGKVRRSCSTLPWTHPSLGPSAVLPSLSGFDGGEGQAVVMTAKSADCSPNRCSVPDVYTGLLSLIVPATRRQCATPSGRSGPRLIWSAVDPGTYGGQCEDMHLGQSAPKAQAPARGRPASLCMVGPFPGWTGSPRGPFGSSSGGSSIRLAVNNSSLTGILY